MIKRQLHPIDRDILRVLMRSRIKVTPSQISKAIGVHPKTAQTRIKELSLKKIINCKHRGNRTYCEPIINTKEMTRRLKRYFLFG